MLALSQSFSIILENEDEILPIYSNQLIESLQLQAKKELRELYSLPYKVTTNPKLRDLQYRICTFIYNTNVILKRKKIKDSALCELCKTKDQDVYHLFFDCKIISDFWLKVTNYFNLKMNLNFDLSRKDVILGNPTFPKILNFVILIGKLKIFAMLN